MAFLVRKAVRKNLPLKIALTGFSGAGKTYSALQLARGLAGSTGKIVLLDTENRRSEYYGELTEFDICPLDAPFSPQRYVDAVKQLEKDYQVIIIDSASHEWDGEGGCLEMSKGNGGIANWKVITPLHKKFTDALLNSPAHVIATIRMKKDVAPQADENGKIKKITVGTKLTQRDTFEYEFALVLDIDQDHKATASKDNTHLFSDPVPQLITVETGEKLRKWNETGEKAPAPRVANQGARTDGRGIISSDQLKKLWATAKLHKWSDEDVKSYLTSVHKLESSKDITFGKMFDAILVDLELGPRNCMAKYNAGAA